MNRSCLTRARRLGVAGGLLLVLWALAGCGRNDTAKKQEPGEPKAVSKRVAAEAENHASDAAFAVQIKDFSRAADSLAKAVKLRDDIPDWWFSLGTLHKKLGQNGEAKSAYKRALGLHEDRYESTNDPADIIAQIYVLMVLDREKDARSLLEKGRRRLADHPQLREFESQKGIDALRRIPRSRIIAFR